ncbi:hypothetical protein LguiA_001253 [Lonicera macranthoides]
MADFHMKLATTETRDGLAPHELLVVNPSFKEEIAVASNTNLLLTPLPFLTTQLWLSKDRPSRSSSLGGYCSEAARKSGSGMSELDSLAMAAQHFRKAPMVAPSTILWKKQAPIAIPPEANTFSCIAT